jgi:hypothetical protein
MLRKVLYTVLYGDQYALLEQPVRRDSALDFIAFTGDPNVRSDTWTIRHLPALIPTDMSRSSRFPKICAHRVLPDYDVSLYIDTKVLLKAPPELILDKLLIDHGASMSCFRHDQRSTIAEEVEAVIQGGLDRADVCRAQMADYARDGYKGTTPLTWSGLLMRFHNRDDVKDAMEKWIAQVLRYSRRDQLSFPYIAEKAGFSFVAHPLANEETEWHRWPLEPDGIADSRASRDPGRRDDRPRGLDDAERDLARARAEILALRMSTSWRMTAPLRKLAGMARGRDIS